MEVKTSNLAKALNAAAIVIERRNTIPILGHAVVRYDGEGEAEIRACNLDQEIRIRTPVVNGKPIHAAFGAPAAIATLVRAGAAESVVIEKGKDSAAGVLQHKILAGQLAGEINALPGEDLPTIGISSASDMQATLGTEQIDMLLRVLGAASKEETRYYLNGIYVHHVEGWNYRAVCTDGHRLYYGNITLPDAVAPSLAGKERTGFIIPRMTMEYIRRIRPHMAKDKPIIFTVAGPIAANSVDDLAAKPSGAMSRVRFAMNAHGLDMELISKTIDGTFPDYSRVIPAANDTDQQISFKRADLRRAIDGITAGQSERVKAIKLTFDPSRERLTVSTQWIDVGFTGKIEIPAKARTKDNKPFEIGYNGHYLRAICDASRGEDLVINVADSASPGTITDPAASDFRTVLMPMRV